jgi:hypothetical protein
MSSTCSILQITGEEMEMEREINLDTGAHGLARIGAQRRWW